MKRCAYCRRKPPEVQLTIDHKIPKVRGGTDELDNLQCLCKTCNQVKGAICHSEVKRITGYWLNIKGYKNNRRFQKLINKVLF